MIGLLRELRSILLLTIASQPRITRGSILSRPIYTGLLRELCSVLLLTIASQLQITRGSILSRPIDTSNALQLTQRTLFYPAGLLEVQSFQDLLGWSY